MKHPQISKRVVPIVPDEARTFGMESLFRQFGIYASQGQLYRPHDAEMFLYYKESKDGQILEEGITEAGSMASLTAAGTAYAQNAKGSGLVVAEDVVPQTPISVTQGADLKFEIEAETEEQAAAIAELILTCDSEAEAREMIANLNARMPKDHNPGRYDH